MKNEEIENEVKNLKNSNGGKIDLKIEEDSDDSEDESSESEISQLPNLQKKIKK